MTPFDMLELLGFVLMAAQMGWIVMLHRRLGALRGALDGAPEVMAQIDAAARRLDEASGASLAAVKEKVAELDAKTQASVAKIQEFDAVTRKAKSVADRLERALRTGRPLVPAAPAALPRERVEPLGFAELMQARQAQGTQAEADAEDPAPAELAQRILAAQMPLAGAEAAASRAAG